MPSTRPKGHASGGSSMRRNQWAVATCCARLPGEPVLTIPLSGEAYTAPQKPVPGIHVCPRSLQRAGALQTSANLPTAPAIFHPSVESGSSFQGKPAQVQLRASSSRGNRARCETVRWFLPSLAYPPGTESAIPYLPSPLRACRSPCELLPVPPPCFPRDEPRPRERLFAPGTLSRLSPNNPGPPRAVFVCEPH